MSYYLIIYLFVGILHDFLLTLNYRFIAKDKTLPAVITSYLVTVVTMLVIYNILTKLDNQRGVIAILVYALGISIGTFFAMKFKFGFKETE
jgi:hypothetical protein